MSEPTSEARGRTPLAKCERHGLHYDPAKMTGCVICRREAQAEAGGPASSSPAASSTRRSLAGPLLVSAVLCFAAGFAFYLLHDAAAKRAGTSAEMPAFGRRQQQRQLEEALREMSRRDPRAMTSGIEDDLPSPGTGPP